MDESGQPSEPGARLGTLLTRRCRESGLPVSVDRTVLLTRAFSAVDLTRHDDLYWAGRAVLTSDPAHIPAYDEVFATVFGRDQRRQDRGTGDADPSVDVDPTGHGEPVAPSDASSSGHPSSPTYSAREALRRRDFAACDPSELAEARRLLGELRLQRPTRPSSRRVRSRRGSLDLGRTLRRSLRTSGELVTPARTSAGARPRRLVLLCDVSGSMASYSRELLRFLHVVTTGSRDAEAFALGTRLTRLTRQLRTSDPDAALRAVSTEVQDWSGGTRLGDGIRRFNRQWAGGPGRGAVVIVLSDGWDRGDPALLSREMEHLRRVARRVIWVNPLRASAGYEPLAGGMAAALPHVDHFVDGHSVAALEDLVGLLR